MASGQRSALSAAVLVGGLVLTGSGAQGVTQAQAPCTLTRNLVVVDLDNVKHRHILRHVFDARRNGHPRVLHIFREEGPANRRESLRGIPTKKGYDRDEYPPAMADEGGEGASRPSPCRRGRGIARSRRRSATSTWPASFSTTRPSARSADARGRKFYPSEPTSPDLSEPESAQPSGFPPQIA
jgi:hypothetical protein